MCIGVCTCMCVWVEMYVDVFLCLYLWVHVCVCVSVGRVAGCLPVFSLAGLHTAAWQQRAGQLNSLNGERRVREREGKRRRGGVRREVEGL